MRQGTSTRSDVTDGLMWRCPQCKTTKSIRQGSSSSKSSLKWAFIVHFWVKEYLKKEATPGSEVGKNTACEVHTLSEVTVNRVGSLPGVAGSPFNNQSYLYLTSHTSYPGPHLAFQ